MELNQLECFLHVAKTEHITQSAEQLHLTQPSLSKTISRLEEDLGAKLFDREGRNIRLNENGKIVKHYAEQIMYTIGDMQAELAESVSGHSGSIRVGSAYNGHEPNWLLSCARDYLISRPDVKFRLQSYPAELLPQALENRDVDLGVTVWPLREPGIHWTELFSEPIGVIMSRHHPLANKEDLSLTDLRHERFYCNDANSDSKQLTLRLCHQAGFQPNIQFECLFPSYIGEAIGRGYGISLISEQGNKRSEKITPQKDNSEWKQNILYRPLKEEYCSRSCGIAYLENRHLPPSVWNFYEFIFQNYDTHQGSLHP